jgi:pimeloyl-ACP methyl ester carboxylesterase
MSRQCSILTADTRLACTDSPGGAPPILFLNGAFATQKDWKPVLRLLGGRHHTVTFDARARGRSGTSPDYSFAGALDDIGRVVEATGLDRPVVAGWSYGASLAVRYAARHPEGVAGVLLIDGAYPITLFDEARKADARRQFRKLGPIMRVLAALGRSARMSPMDAADVIIELDEVNGRLGRDFDALTCPVEYIVGTGAHMGASETNMRTMRATATAVTAEHDNVSVFATVPCNHVQILTRAADTVVAAIDDLARRTGASERASD